MQRVAETALIENMKKLTPPSRSVAPNGAGWSSDTRNLQSFGLSTTSVSTPPPPRLLAFTTTGSESVLRDFEDGWEARYVYWDGEVLVSYWD